MTSGSPLRLILVFMIPLLLGNLFQQFYNIVDAMIVGRLLGADALAAVGSSSSVQFLVLGFCMGSCAGFGIPVSQRFGAEDMQGLRRYVYHSLVVTAIIAVVLTVLSRDSLIISQFTLRLSSAKRNEPMTPMLAASVGVA